MFKNGAGENIGAKELSSSITFCNSSKSAAIDSTTCTESTIEKNFFSSDQVLA